MATIFILKQIIDLVCEELTKTKSTNSQPESVKHLEEMLHKRDEELATLYKENIKLENRIRQIESELDVFSVINPQIKSEEDTTEVKNEVVNEPTKQTVEAEPQQTKKEEEPTKPKRKRDSEERRQYMKEYGKKYRQRQREKKIEMNL
jgi:predicted unusual protein kinase regulating ubiquinone biosynthesis (AarF/ABC1/UbiB family)